MKTKTEDQVRESLLETGFITPISFEKSYNGWGFLCRQVPGQEKEWLACIELILKWEQVNIKEGEELLVARKYLLKNDKMVFGWLLRFKAKDAKVLPEMTSSFLRVIEDFRKNLPETEEELPMQPVQVFKAQVPQAPPQVSKAVAKQSGGPVLKMVHRSKDEKGRITEIQEMPLAHVTKDLNVPTKPVWSESHGRFVGGEKGAKGFSGGGSF